MLITALSLLISSDVLAQARYKIVDDTLIFDMTFEELGYEFDGELD
jgi:hypothetical protein